MSSPRLCLQLNVNSKVLLFQIKSLLSVDSYKLFSKALMEYKKQEDLLKVVAVLADLFTHDKRNYHLFASMFV